MKRFLLFGVLLTGLASLALAAVSTVHGTITKVDSTAKTVVIKTADGTEHVVQFAGKTVVHGTEAGATDVFHGLKEGSEVVARYTEKGTAKTAVEVDRVGAGGLKLAEGTVTDIDHDGKKVAVTATDGTKHTFRLADHAVEDAGKGIEKSAKVTVYYTELSGKKIAHVLWNGY